ncbi:hypothetical protein TrispH2_007308 [Trichoplax sp. H2]|nr:hypothetical protein TrispH2_007308 [Trichoplax sp. H2]|eukprot:RDD40526.1 hypothetical protein TrispH2_007308 [Trichoplax sp. H2]
MTTLDTVSLLSSEDDHQNLDQNLELSEDERHLSKDDCDETKKTVQLPLCNRSISKNLAGTIITIITVFGQSGMAIALPTFSVAVNAAHCHSNQYFVLIYPAMWFPIIFSLIAFASKAINPKFSLKSYTAIKAYIILGLLCAVNCLLVTFASLPDRTPPNLQGILGITIIPFTVILRYAILRKKVGVGRLLCTLGTLVGLFITLVPNIFNIEKNKHHGSKSVIWPLIFILGILPAAIANVLQEKEMKRDYREESLVFQAWVAWYNVFFLGLLFWTGFIPHFGQASNIQQFQHQMDCGFLSQFGGGKGKVPSYPWALGAAWLFISFYCIANQAALLLLRYSDGAIYLVIVQAIIPPIVAIFWTLFTLKGGFHWHPRFTDSSAFVFAGIIVILPCIIIYNYLTLKEEKAESNKI